MEINNLKTKILEFIKDKNIRGALYISGPWGVGKTTFIKEFQDETKITTNKYSFKDRKSIKKSIYKSWEIHLKNKSVSFAERIQNRALAKQEYKFFINKKSIYLSLNGVSTIEQLNNELFKETHPKHYRFKSILKKINEMDISISAPFVGLSVKPFTVDDKIGFFPGFLIFDDLERTLIDLRELFGYFSRLIEESNLKIILIGNTEQIEKYIFSDEQFRRKLISVIAAKEFCKSDVPESIAEKINEISKNIFSDNTFKVIKEKVIVEECELEYSDQTLINIIDGYSSIKSIVKSQIPIIGPMIKNRVNGNLRIFIKILNNFKCACKNNLIADAPNQFKIKFLRTISEILVSDYEDKAINIKNSFENMFDESNFLSSAKNFIKTGEINESLVKSEIAFENQNPRYDLFDDLIGNWQEQEDDFIIEDIKKLIEDLKNSNVPIKKLYLSYLYLYKFYKLGFKQPCIDFNDIKKYIINKIEKSNIYVDTEYFGMYVDINDIEETHKANLNEIILAYNKANSKIKDKETIENIQNMKNQLKLNYKQLNDMADLAISRRKFASAITKDEFYELVSNSNNKQLCKLISIIKRVYNISNINEFLNSDVDSLKIMIDVIKEEKSKLDVDKKSNVLRKANLDELSKLLKNIVDRLNK